MLEKSDKKLDIEQNSPDITSEEALLELNKLLINYSEELTDPEILGDIEKFVLNAAFNQLQGATGDKYNSQQFDKDSEKGLDKFEFENFTRVLNDGIAHIITLGGVEKLDKVESDIKEDIEAYSIPAKVKQLTGGKSLTDTAISKFANITPEDAEKLLKAKWKDEKFFEGILFATGREAPQMVEDILLFLEDAIFLATPPGLAVFSQYYFYRFKENFSSNTSATHEYKMKVDAMAAAHPLLGLLNLVGERGLHLTKHIASLLTNPGEWTAEGIVIAITSLAGLVAGGAGAVRGLTRIGLKAAAKGGRIAKTLNTVGRAADTVSKVATNVDNVVNLPITATFKAAGEVPKLFSKKGSVIDIGKSLVKVPDSISADIVNKLNDKNLAISDRRALIIQLPRRTKEEKAFVKAEISKMRYVIESSRGKVLDIVAIIRKELKYCEENNIPFLQHLGEGKVPIDNLLNDLPADLQYVVAERFNFFVEDVLKQEKLKGLSPDQLVEKFFGFTPVGKIKAEVGSLSTNFEMMDDGNFFAAVASDSSIHPEAVFNYGAFKRTTSEGDVIVENISDPENLAHESQHIGFEKIKRPKPSSKNLDEAQVRQLEKATEVNIASTIDEVLIPNLKQALEEKVKDEILAYITQSLDSYDFNRRQIYKSLTARDSGAIYDYTGKLRQGIISTLEKKIPLYSV